MEIQGTYDNGTVLFGVTGMVPESIERFSGVPLCSFSFTLTAHVEYAQRRPWPSECTIGRRQLPLCSSFFQGVDGSEFLAPAAGVCGSWHTIEGFRLVGGLIIKLVGQNPMDNLCGLLFRLRRQTGHGSGDSAAGEVLLKQLEAIYIVG